MNMIKFIFMTTMLQIKMENDNFNTKLIKDFEQSVAELK